MNHLSYLDCLSGCEQTDTTTKLRFERQLRFEARAIASDGRDGERRLTLEEPYRRIVRVERAIDLHPVPSFGMADVPNRHVVVLAPEERHGLERLASAQYVSRGRLRLTFGDDPVLDPDVLPDARIGPTCDIAGCEDAGLARPEKLIDHDPAVDLQA